MVGTVLIDLSKAFDTINHARFITNLNHNGVSYCSGSMTTYSTVRNVIYFGLLLALCYFVCFITISYLPETFQMYNLC